MASEILGLFTSPENYQLGQQQMAQDEALQFARLTPMQKASYGAYQGGRGLADFGGRLLGGEDPQLKKITMRQQMLTGAGGMPPIDLNDPNSMLRAANAAQGFDPEFAQGLIAAANDLAKNLADIRSKTATAAKTELNITQEENLRKELSNLGPTPTNEQILAVVSKYGPPDKILSALQGAQTAQAERERRTEESQAKLEQRKQDLADKAANDAQARQEKFDRDLAILRENNASRAEQARLQREFLANENRQKALDRKALSDLTQAAKPLPPGIQKAEDADYEAATAAINLANDADKYLNSIQSGNIKFGLKDRLSITARSALGSNDPDVVARNDFERFKKTIINESLRLNKGTQTEGDAARATKELEGAESPNDAAKAIQTLRDLNARRAGDYVGSIDRRRANSKLAPVEIKLEVPKFEPRVFTNADYAALPKGTVFIDDKGVRRRKP